MLDPQVAAWLAGLRRDGLDHFERIESFSPQSLRAAFDALRRPAATAEVAGIEDRLVPGPAGAGRGGEVPIRIYWPAAGTSGTAPRPVVVFFHGGGWMMGSVDRADALVRNLTARSGLVFVSVEYRLAPEHPFPAGAEDCYAATSWVVDHAAAIGGDPARVAVAGESAGANLAAVVALMGRDRGHPSLGFQLLVYPSTDMDPAAHPSHDRNGTGYFLTASAMAWFYEHYVTPDQRNHPYAAPLRAADLSGLPPALVITAGFDPLHDEGTAYAQRLQAAGVAVELLPFPGQVHGFVAMDAILDEARAAQTAAVAGLRAALAGGDTNP